jgi:hypothetical protein
MAKWAEVPNSYKDPYWTNLASQTEKKLGLPSGSLQSILLNGEKSNVDQVSSAGARTPFQIIPETRKAIIEKYKIDPYVSPEMSAEAAGLLIQESLQRNKGDIELAVREYHGGTNPKNWGKVNQSYAKRVLEGLTNFIPAAQAGEMPQNASMEQKIVDAYRSGKMTAQEAAEFEADVQSGAFKLPAGQTGAEGLVTESVPGMSIQYPTEATAPQATQLPTSIWDAYTTGVMTPQEKSELEADVKSGLVALPTNVQMSAPELNASEVAGAVTRGLAPITGGAMLGAAIGAPIGGVGAVPGALAGAAAGALAPIVADPIVSGINSLLGTNYQMPSLAMEDLFTRIGVAEPKSEAAKILQTVTSAAGGAGGVAAGGKLLQTAAQSPMMREVGRQFGAQPAAQVVGSVTSETAGQVAEQQGASPEVAMLARLAGGVGGGAVTSKLSGARIAPTGITPEQQQAIQAAEQAGIRTMTSDVFPPQTFMGKTAQMSGERIPFAGTGGIRRTQAEERIDAVKDVIKYYGGDGADAITKAPAEVMLDVATKRATDLTKYSTAKNEVIDRLSSVGTVPVQRTIAQIDQELARLQGIKSEQLEPVIRVLDDWRNAIQNQNLRNVEELRKIVGNAFADPSLASVRDIGEKSLSSIYAPLKQDMTDYIKFVGERRDIDKWGIANKRLSALSGELKSNTLKNVLNRGNVTPEVIESMLFSQKTSDLQTLFKNLTPAGRANARTSIIARATEKSGGVDNISPEKFVTELKRLGNPVKVFFSGDDLNRVQGLVKALKLTSRASVANVSTQTGMQGVPFLAGSFLTDFLGGAGAATFSAGTIGLVARIYESKVMRELLTKMAIVKTGSAEEAALAKRFVSIVESQSRNMSESQATQQDQEQ